MKKVVVFSIVLLTLLSGCFEGVTGPKGPKGEDGSLTIEEHIGVLYAADRIEDVSTLFHWNIFVFIPDRAIVTVHVRKGAGYMWNEPFWQLSVSSDYVRINDDDFADIADEYRIIVAY